MRFRSTALGLVLLVCVSVNAQEPPRDSGVVEQTGRRLVQIDVSVDAPPQVLAELTKDRFLLTVGKEEIRDFFLDTSCVDHVVRPDPSTARPPSEPVPGEMRLRSLMYFDQTHLTSAGRRRSLELARGLVRRLAGEAGAELMIVSASRRLEVVHSWTDNADDLMAALDSLEANPEQVSVWADMEERRVARMMDSIEKMNLAHQEAAQSFNRAERTKDQNTARNGPIAGQNARASFRADMRVFEDEKNNTIQALDMARAASRATARELSREESARTESSLGFLHAALQHLDGHAPPKSVIYFADTMRANAGDFFIDMYKSTDRYGSNRNYASDGGKQIGLAYIQTGNYVAAFQEAIDIALEKGIRFYTVQGRGLVERQTSRSRAASAAVSNKAPVLGRARFIDAEKALSGLAKETGGRSFLWGADASLIGDDILRDLSCLFVFSFRPVRLEEDRRKPVWIEVDVPEVDLRYRPYVISLSEKQRRRERLENAFWAGSDETDARLSVLPTGFDGGKYTLLVQFAIPGSDLAGNDWDMGITAVVGKSRTLEASGRVATNQPGVPLVFEAEIRFPPGEYTITGVARSNDHGELISTKAQGTLPDPDDSDPFVVSIVMLQRANGAFARGETTKNTGSLAHEPQHWLNPERATGILALVCGNKRSDPVVATRSLVGDSAVSFDPVELDFSQERCGLLVDTIDGNVLTSGKFSYAVHLAREAEAVSATRREFLVVTQEEIALAKKDEAPAP